MSGTNTRDEARIPVSVWRDGRDWNGWYVVKGREVEVFSAYGSMTQKLGRMAPERVAERMLADVVVKWRGR